MFTRIVASLALLSPFASASTYTVDAAGGGNFTDIQSAILATQPGDVLLVQAGYYAGFTLDRGLTIIGYGACDVWGPISISGVPAGETAVMVKIETQFLSIQSCAGHVIVQEMQQPVAVSVDSSPDVRFARLSWNSVQVDPPAPGLQVSGGSRVELVDSNTVGCAAVDCNVPALAGGFGVGVSNSRLHATRTSIEGGHGAGCNLANYFCGRGGTGLDLAAGADVIACGTWSQQVIGGHGGVNMLGGSGCWDNVPGGPVVLHAGAALRWSGLQIPTSYGYSWGPSCAWFSFPGIDNQGGTVTNPQAIDPHIVVSGTPVPGSSVVFTLYGPGGSTVVLSFGRNAVVQPDPNTLIEVLTPPARNVNLGQIPGSGHVSFTWPIASVLLPGTRLLAQGRCTLPSGEVRRTNSVPVILR
jgi:hypothetical protein